jgi:hypothetical protein
MANKKEVKKAKKQAKKRRKALLKTLKQEGYKSSCCKKYKNSIPKRCKRCPQRIQLQKVA